MDETNDLANVSDLSDGSLVRLLKKRYESGRIYVQQLPLTRIVYF